MKDKVARQLLKGLANVGGYLIAQDAEGTYYVTTSSGGTAVSKLEAKITRCQERITELQVKLADFERKSEVARPTCKTCGQKIQDGFKAGQIETLAADVKRKR